MDIEAANTEEIFFGKVSISVSTYLLGYDPVLYRNYLAALKPEHQAIRHCDAAKYIILSRVVAMRHPP